MLVSNIDWDEYVEEWPSAEFSQEIKQGQSIYALRKDGLKIGSKSLK